ncbi:MAG: DUF1501 domain-containing protein [Pyrinomonadaceae bacterium]
MNETRRDFLKKTGGCALGMVSLATQMHHLGAMTAMAQKVIDSQPLAPEVNDYKALVLVYWQGGQDGNNIVIPFHDDASDPNVSPWATYNSLRTAQASGGLAFTQAQLAATQITVPNIGSRQYALHPNFDTPGQINRGIHELYGQNKLAIVANVGNLVRPLTKAQYQSASYKKPYQLFSHSDQVTQSQTSRADTQAFTGWGGRLADQVDVQNTNGRLIPMVTSIAGAQLFTNGQITLPLAISQANNTGTNNLTGVLTPAGLSGTNATVLARLSAFNALRGQDLGSNYVAAASHVTDLAMQANTALQSSQDVVTTFPNTGLGLQLKQVARLIRGRTNLQINRQVFYVQIGSHDTHTGQISAQGNLVTQFSQAMRSFWDELGTMPGMQDSVTTFTLSDFGRTLNPAGVGNSSTVGSDHAWGNHMFVMGGAVAGGNIYGSRRPDASGTGGIYPTLALGGLDDVDNPGVNARGRWIPTTSVDQYAAVLAKWFGLPQDAATLAQVFPNLANFNVGTFPSLNFLP